MAILSNGYKTISRFDYTVSNLEFKNILEELQGRIETKQLNTAGKCVILNSYNSEVMYFKNVIKLWLGKMSFQVRGILY